MDTIVIAEQLHFKLHGAGAKPFRTLAKDVRKNLVETAIAIDEATEGLMRDQYEAAREEGYDSGRDDEADECKDEINELGEDVRSLEGDLKAAEDNLSAEHQYARKLVLALQTAGHPVPAR